jgi:ribose transport system substrate-binding protein
VKRHRSALAAAVAVTACALAISACGDDGASGTSSSGSGKAKRLRLAFLPGVTANPYFQAEIEAVKAVAARHGADVTVIDSQLDAQKQVSQLQDLAATKKYDGVVIVPLNGAALVPAVQQALQTGTKIGAADVPIGPDPTSTATQVKGVSVYSGRPFSVTGDHLGRLTVEACKGKDPCRVAFMYGVKASTYDQALHSGFAKAIKAAANIRLVAEAEGMYTREGGLKAAQDIVQAHRDLDVLVAVDQSALGAESALKSAGVSDRVKIIGFAGTAQAIAAVKSGRWFGDVVQVPRTEARLAAEGVIAAIRNGKDTGYVDPVAAMRAPDEGRIVRSNASAFRSEYDG